jgi:hypothetical protein
MNVEVYSFCMLDKMTGSIDYYSKPLHPEFTGLYFRDDNTHEKKQRSYFLHKRI